MAHATDYASRKREFPISVHARVNAQLWQFFDESIHWPARAVREYCMSSYKSLGVTPEIYNDARENWLKMKA
jgi:hypothetical protein